MRTKVLYALTIIFAVTQAAAAPLHMSGVIRDFSPNTNPDFEYNIQAETGIVKTQLGGDGKPVFSGGSFATIHSQTTFDQWYRDVPNVNIVIPYAIDLTDDDGDGIYTYENNAFFPIDNDGFGKEGRNHNFHFTFEVHSTFTYKAGQHFSFIGDDDVWVFINDQLVVDIGGVHGALPGSIDLDTLGLTVDNDYTFAFFFAERHTTESHFKIQTSIKLIPAPTPCPVRPEQQAVWGWYKQSINDHFYTAAPGGEIAQISGYINQGIRFYTLIYPGANTKAIYRVWSGAAGQHIYTTSSTERATLIANGYSDEGVLGYIYATQEGGTVALSRYASTVDGKNFYSRDGDAAPAGYNLVEVMGYIY